MITQAAIHRELTCEFCGKKFGLLTIPKTYIRRTCSASCQSSLAVRSGAGMTANYVFREDRLLKPPEMPTNTLVGSIERIEVYRQRVNDGEEMFHPGDCTFVQPETVDRGKFRALLRKVKVAKFVKKHWKDEDYE